MEPTDRIDAARERRRAHLTAAVRTLRSEPGFRAWLTARRTFHSYSPMNVLWIVTQCPHASHVAGFRTWRDRLGYQVRKGEKGIAIVVPRPFRAGDPNRSSEEATKRLGISFRVGHVFDRSQVDPIPGRAQRLEPLARPAPITGDSHAHLIGPLEGLAAELGYKVERIALPAGTGGVCDSAGMRILLGAGQSVNSQVRVLVHERAHALGVDYEEFGRGRAEAIVDTVAYLVCAGQGLDVEASAVPYIAAWAEDDSSAVESVALLIDRLAGRIERAITGTQAPRMRAAV